MDLYRGHSSHQKYKGQSFHCSMIAAAALCPIRYAVLWGWLLLGRVSLIGHVRLASVGHTS